MYKRMQAYSSSSQTCPRSLGLILVAILDQRDTHKVDAGQYMTIEGNGPLHSKPTK